MECTAANSLTRNFREAEATLLLLFILIRPSNTAPSQDCHPERGVAESKDLRLLALRSVSIQSGRIHKRGPGICF
jgi:hypothetical protein